jgi:phosphatidylethanolamine/phosphatidyl-N-methylethanolamine N-methyltransferase
MKINTNSWNKLRYTLYTPVYDLILMYFKKSRKKSIDSLSIKPGNKILLIGAGTGLDLDFIPDGCEIIATDITPSMIEKIKKRNKLLNKNVSAIVMDGQKLNFADNSFDIVILHLILAVIPNPIACIKESERVLKPGGYVGIYDKFVPKNTKISLLRKFLNVFANFFFTDITRDFESMLSKTNYSVISDVDADFNGNFRIIKLKKI